MTDPRLPALWLQPEIAGFSARLGHFDPDDDNDMDLLLQLMPLEKFVPADSTANIWRFTTPHEVITHARRVFALWRQGPDGVYALAAPSLAELGEVMETTRALQAQVVAAGEIVVITAPIGDLEIGFRSIRGRVAVESMKALTGSQRFVACQRCGGWFPIERVGAAYCSRRCQTAQQRARKEMS